MHRGLLAGALLVLAAGVGLRLAAVDLGALAAKQDLGPARLLHGLSLAYAMVALWRGREVALRGWPMRALAAAGRQSLHVFCVGLFLSYGLAVLFRLLGWHAWLEALVVAGGLALLAFAALAEGAPGLTRAPKNVEK